MNFYYFHNYCAAAANALYHFSNIHIDNSKFAFKSNSKTMKISKQFLQAFLSCLVLVYIISNKRKHSKLYQLGQFSTSNYIAATRGNLTIKIASSISYLLLINSFGHGPCRHNIVHYTFWKSFWHLKINRFDLFLFFFYV